MVLIFQKRTPTHPPLFLLLLLPSLALSCFQEETIVGDMVLSQRETMGQRKWNGVMRLCWLASAVTLLVLAERAVQRAEGLSPEERGLVVERHNVWRRQYGSPELVYNLTLEETEFTGTEALAGACATVPTLAIGDLWAQSLAWLGSLPQSAEQRRAALARIIDGWAERGIAQWDCTTDTCSNGEGAEEGTTEQRGPCSSLRYLLHQEVKSVACGLTRPDGEACCVDRCSPCCEATMVCSYYREGFQKEQPVDSTACPESEDAASSALLPPSFFVFVPL
ncbi:hypothetical protein QOT17_003802 [Balamuthia mandrillaris]